MSLNLPDSSEILNRTRADIKQVEPNSNPYEVVSILNAWATSQSNRIREVYDQALLISRDTFLTTAQDEALTEKANVEGVFLLPATQSSGNAIFTGTVGTNIPSSTNLVSNNINYLTSSSVTISNVSLSVDSITSTSGVATVTFLSDHGFGSGMTVSITGADQADYNGDKIITVTSATTFEYAVSGSPASPATGTILAAANMAVSSITSIETGIVTNIEGGGTLQLSSTISGASSTIYTQFEGIDGAEDEETQESLRERAIFKKQNPNTPFNVTEIITQAREVPGVTRVFVFESNDLNRIDSVTATALVSGIVQITFPTDHNLVSGMKIEVAGAVEPEFNGIFRVVVNGLNTVAYFSSGATGTATGSITADYSEVQLGQTVIYFLRDNDANIIPSAAELTEVKDKILEIKPANTDDSNVFVKAPIPNPTDFTFTSVTPDTQGIRDSIEINLQSLFQSISLGETITETAYKTSIQNSFDSANAIGVTDFTLSSPVGDLVPNYNEILTINSISF